MYHNLRKNGTDEVRIERSRMRNMKVVDTREYVGMLKELTEEGKKVSMLVFGSSMAPFLIHARDMIYFKKPDRELQKGDIVFFRRKSGQFVMHRIWKIKKVILYFFGERAGSSSCTGYGRSGRRGIISWAMHRHR